MYDYMYVYIYNDDDSSSNDNGSGTCGVMIPTHPQVLADVKSLEAKLRTLTEQESHFQDTSAERLSAAKAEGGRSKRRARRQLELEEKQVRGGEGRLFAWGVKV